MLPLMQYIQHVIDFIHEAFIHNGKKMMISIEHVGIQHKVEELHKKSLIRESVSPCDVPALLVPRKKMCKSSSQRDHS